MELFIMKQKTSYKGNWYPSSLLMKFPVKVGFWVRIPDSSLLRATSSVGRALD